MSFTTALETIASGIESLTPASDSNGNYFQGDSVKSLDQQANLSGRMFYFEETDVDFTDQGGALEDASIYRIVNVELVVCYPLFLGKDLLELKTRARQDMEQIEQYLNGQEWSGLVHLVTCTRARKEPLDLGDSGLEGIQWVFELEIEYSSN